MEVRSTTIQNPAGRHVVASGAGYPVGADVDCITVRTAERACHAVNVERQVADVLADIVLVDDEVRQRDRQGAGGAHIERRRGADRLTANVDRAARGAEGYSISRRSD